MATFQMHPPPPCLQTRSLSVHGNQYENCFSMTFGEDYGYKDSAESMILSAGTESMILSACAESIILSLGLLLPLLPPCCRHCCLCLCRGSSGGSTGKAVCRRRGIDIATTVVDFVFVFLFLFLLLHADGVVMSCLFSSTDIGVTASSIAGVVILGAVILQVETKMVPTTTTMATTNEACHGMPSTPLSNHCLREGKGKGNESKGGRRHCGRQW
jgi:hypothetical protein